MCGHDSLVRLFPHARSHSAREKISFAADRSTSPFHSPSNDRESNASQSPSTELVIIGTLPHFLLRLLST